MAELQIGKCRAVPADAGTWLIRGNDNNPNTVRVSSREEAKKILEALEPVTSKMEWGAWEDCGLTSYKNGKLYWSLLCGASDAEGYLAGQDFVLNVKTGENRNA
uniref:Uncharacterized protein n=1 Tax=Paramoeba aestuarina TaxID=180227 RepID=A0A7S4UD92_9EUKA|mmetsp:Transcript_35660/g.55669  ORF Transcript_35660/g.55669 Transcript_35660/m.55669 type:complete len:104 (+) Transcript_35660:144-455(+)|eukprot:CAMPEP_0201526694 /NCGR_PEP_ID=MMETSP0161_2-20130828/32616_1 /ASSEMBLY_ACC=CAM_ASM_000251 /TAXON_ID=180227 /ORGANISM="Neoparamoeba aestuarina, Strain SoJaBio B1-5/56/2" /LENGTH=103 /DNA_ID=CAMNT_0047927185 /DNA_START=55 /DNA_END=366 /DNA_ORIENTATION=-